MYQIILKLIIYVPRTVIMKPSKGNIKELSEVMMLLNLWAPHPVGRVLPMAQSVQIS